MIQCRGLLLIKRPTWRLSHRLTELNSYLGRVIYTTSVPHGDVCTLWYILRHVLSTNYFVVTQSLTVMNHNPSTPEFCTKRQPYYSILLNFVQQEIWHRSTTITKKTLKNIKKLSSIRINCLFDLIRSETISVIYIKSNQIKFTCPETQCRQDTKEGWASSSNRCSKIQKRWYTTVATTAVRINSEWWR